MTKHEMEEQAWTKGEQSAYFQGMREGANQTRKRIRVKIRRMLAPDRGWTAGAYIGARVFAEDLVAWIRTMDDRSRKRKGGM